MQVDHDYLGQSLADVNVDIGASGAHGLMCGLVCAGEKAIQQQFDKEWFAGQPEGDPAVAECKQALDELLRTVYAAIDGVEFVLPLLLPDENSPLQQRAASVRDWCEGFLYGVGLAETKGEDGLPAQVREALNDLAEISRMDIDAIAGEEEEEVALTEVTEFIWVAAMLVHDELVSVESAGKEQ